HVGARLRRHIYEGQLGNERGRFASARKRARAPKSFSCRYSPSDFQPPARVVCPTIPRSLPPLMVRITFSGSRQERSVIPQIVEPPPRVANVVYDSTAPATTGKGVSLQVS